LSSFCTQCGAFTGADAKPEIGSESSLRLRDPSLWEQVAPSENKKNNNIRINKLGTDNCR
jgi:hypothetical protein